LEVGNESYWKLKVENGSWKGKLLEIEVGSWNLKFEI